MDLDFNKNIITNFGLLLSEIKRIREIEDNKRYQLQRMTDELNAIRFTLE